MTITRYPTRPGLFFYYPNRNRKFFQNFRVQGSNSTRYQEPGLLTTTRPEPEPKSKSAIRHSLKLKLCWFAK